ncbi:P-loop NTPase fold protein [Streptomyces sp. NPDC059517]|uniref:KAP family P-loop NTPase fold protein n=1 Tax=Streptomyces sp. NPDC059517 TaxID=3346855 RepID=UPI0036A6325E
MTQRSSSHLEQDDLIQDREVDNAQDDRLAHSHIADQLHDVVLSVPTPTNIAVWGPWGSGKSGVANLLQGQLAKQRDVRFVRFDAFKYAENPLRRNFIIAVATALGIKDSRFHDELYNGRVAVKLQFERGEVWRLLKTFGQMFGAVVTFFAVVMSLLAWVRGGAFRPAFADVTSEALKAGIAPAALLTSLAVLVSRTLTREHKTEAADSDEQFEKLFADLVARADTKRLIVFVDELDRCTPSDVVATLNALRTFLGANGCVFVVAADQQVLEEALTRALEQATPADTVNPYYSSGSGYLDKVFQYQISLPPLLVPRVTRFAADLVRTRGGVWATLDIDLTMSVLVPSHVRSPRRVKALLNTFALTYRLAQRRAAEGLLETDPATRAPEIAKLVCLRIEFPLFARDLLLDHRLCEYVLALDADPKAVLGNYVRPEVREAARRYANLEAAVDLHLIEPKEPGEDDGKEENAAEIRKSHGQQLVSYLKRTRTVPGPSGDLIYMETSGSAFGLPASLAEALEQQAQNAELDAVVAIVDGLPTSARPAALSLLTQQARDAIGLEEENVAHSVLAVCSNTGVPLDGAADPAVEILTPILTNSAHELPVKVLDGCWRLALASSRPAALEMRSIVLRHSVLRHSPSMAAMVVRHVEQVLAAAPALVQQLVSQHLLLAEKEDMADMLAELPATEAAMLMTHISPHATNQLRELIKKHQEWAAEQESSEAAATDTPRQEPHSPADALRRLQELLEHWCEACPEAAHVVVGLLLALDSLQGRNIVEECAASIPAVRETPLARAVLSSASPRAVTKWPTWLELLDPRSSTEDMVDEFNGLLKKLWTQTSRPNDALAPAVVGRVADSFMRLFDHWPSDQHPHITPFVLRSLSRPTTDEEATEQIRLLGALLPLANSGVLKRTAFVHPQAAALTELLTDGDSLVVSQDSTLLTYIELVLTDCLRDLGSSVTAPLAPEEARSLVGALDDAGWLPGHEHTRLRVRAHHLLMTGGVDRHGMESMPPAAAMAEHARSNSGSVGGTVAAWIALAEPSASDLFTAVSASLRRPSALQTDMALLPAVASRLAALPTLEQAGFWKDALGGSSTHLPEQTLIGAGWPSLTDGLAAELLVDRYSRASKNADRRAVLDLWKAANITQPAARHDLIQAILLPMLDANQGAADLALSYLPQLMDSVPKGMKKTVRTAVEASGSKWTSLAQRGVKALKSVGYSTERSGLLKLGERISRSNDD